MTSRKPIGNRENSLPASTLSNPSLRKSKRKGDAIGRAGIYQHFVED
jgi:hypothetical protein